MAVITINLPSALKFRVDVMAYNNDTDFEDMLTIILKHYFNNQKDLTKDIKDFKEQVSKLDNIQDAKDKLVNLNKALLDLKDLFDDNSNFPVLGSEETHKVYGYRAEGHILKSTLMEGYNIITTRRLLAKYINDIFSTNYRRELTSKNTTKRNNDNIIFIDDFMKYLIHLEFIYSPEVPCRINGVLDKWIGIKL